MLYGGASVDGDPWPALLRYARWAPSPHNIQSWKLRPLGVAEAELLVDPARTLPVTDPSGRFVAVGLGVFVESLAVAAHAHGYELDVDHDGAGPAPGTAFARLSLRPSPVDDLPPELVLERRTSRLPYDGRPVDDAVLRELGELAGRFGQHLGWSHDHELVEWLVALNRDTLFYDLEDGPTRDEIGIWMRYTASSAARRRDGFAPECLGFPGPVLYVFFRLPWVASLPVVRQLLHRLYFATMRGTRTIAWVKGPFATAADWFRAGRMLGRFWLVLTSHGVRLHPFGSIITNPRAHARLLERLAPDESEDELWLVMRVGYSEEPPRSHRLEVDEVLVD